MFSSAFVFYVCLLAGLQNN